MPFPVMSDDNPSVFVVGSLVVACCAQVARCPEPGESLAASGFMMEAGGKGFNVAMAAHRLGVAVDGVFVVGDDPPGLFMRQAFGDQGLAASMIHTVNVATGAGVGLIQDDGENRIAVYPGANEALTADHVIESADRLRSSDMVFAQFEAPDAPIAAAFVHARSAGIPTMLNPSPYRRISDDILASTDIMVVNEREAVALADAQIGSGTQDATCYEALAHSLLARGASAFIVTRGARGALGWWRGKRIDQAGWPVDVVDSIGAGDAFAGGLIAALIHRQDMKTALQWGCAAGAIAVTRFGLVKALPEMPDLLEMLEIGGFRSERKLP